MLRREPEIPRSERETLRTRPGAMPCTTWWCEAEAEPGTLRCARHAHERVSGPPPSEWLQLQAAELRAAERKGA